MIASLYVVLVVAAAALALYALIDSRGKSATAWAIALLAVALLTR